MFLPSAERQHVMAPWHVDGAEYHANSVSVAAAHNRVVRSLLVRNRNIRSLLVRNSNSSQVAGAALRKPAGPQARSLLARQHQIRLEQNPTHIPSHIPSPR